MMSAMLSLATSAPILATAQRTVGLVMMTIVISLVLLYLFFNIRNARSELGSEIEIAPNRKEYFPDEVLEGKVLDRALSMGLIVLTIVGLTLPLYWLAEPGRQAGAIKEFDRIFASRGEGLYEANCASCHGPGAVGGVASKILLTPEGDYIDTVNWTAPALNNILLRYDREEVTFVLNHGRRFSPMQPWSTIGGGAMTFQQIQNLVDYMESIQLTPDEAQAQVLEGIEDAKATYAREGREFNLGEALFNMESFSKSYSCARCHTAGFSYGQPAAPGTGGFGPSLVGSGAAFVNDDQYVAFIQTGCSEGQTYGLAGQCDGGGQMPGFGSIYTEEQIRAIVEYEKSLTGEAQ